MPKETKPQTNTNKKPPAEQKSAGPVSDIKEITENTENTKTPEHKNTEAVKNTENTKILSDTKAVEVETAAEKAPQAQEIKEEKKSAVPATEPAGKSEPPVQKEGDTVKAEIVANKPSVPDSTIQAEPTNEKTEIESNVIEKSAPAPEVKEEVVLTSNTGNEFVPVPEIKPNKIEKSAPTTEIKEEVASAPEFKPVRIIKERKIDPEASFALKFMFKLRNLREQANRKRRKMTKEHKEKIIAFALKHNRIDNEEVRKITGLSQTQARYYLDILEKQRKLTQIGKRGPKVFYMPLR